MRISFDFLDLEAFLAVKATRSFHVASKRLNLSQSSVTRRVKKLESAVGTLLFERTTREVKPTLAAKRLQLRAEAILRDAQETTQAMRDESAAFAHQRAQTVVVATIPTVVDALLSPAIASFRDAGQTARIRVLDLAANEVAEAVAQGEVDVGICSIPMLEPVTDFELLLNEPVVVALPTGHALSAQDTVCWSDLDKEQLILPTRGTGNRLLIDEALARSRSSVRWTYEVGRSATALDLVSNGLGVAPLPRMALSRVTHEDVCWRNIREPEVLRQIGLLSRTGQRDTSATVALKKAIATAARMRF